MSIQQIFRRLALILFCIYLAVFPGSTIVVALDRVPSWGTWMGGALLLLQGAAALCWLVAQRGARGGLAALLVFLLAWAIEHIGVTTGVLFGQYRYTEALQPQLFGTVPLAIPCAWLMVAAGAWQLATAGEPRTKTQGYSSLGTRRSSLFPAATLVLLLDLQIETVATKINRYWIWRDGGPYYGVPTTNFVAWWLAGVVMALIVEAILPRSGDQETRRPGDRDTRQKATGLMWHVSCLMSHVSYWLPSALYLLSTLMFTIINLAHGYSAAGLVGLLVLLGVLARITWPARPLPALFARVERSERAE